QWSPNSSCGGSTVNIQNRSTQALYNYTPYQPNQSALNAGYGTGDGCGAYGNRNFYLYFTDWFGSVRANDTLNAHPDGTLVSFNSSVYLIQANTLHHITNGAVFESHNYRWGDIKPATSGDKKLAISWPINYISPGVLYTGDSTGVYTTVYENGQWVKQLVSYNSFNSLGYNWSRVRTVFKDQLPTSTSSTILTSSRHPDGTLVKNGQGVFMIDNGTRRYISPPVFNSHRWSWLDIVPETAEDRTLPAGANMLLRQGSIITDGANLFVVQLPASGPEIKRAIGPWECYANIFKYNTDEIIYMNRFDLPQNTGSNVSC
ncbi:MAG: exported protein of unknown function, partial [Marmoricola sp.]|nr:exported protein of unknown function [Marmoricola sp.]